MVDSDAVAAADVKRFETDWKRTDPDWKRGTYPDWNTEERRSWPDWSKEEKRVLSS